MGLYDEVTEHLKKANISFVELEGVVPSPRIEKACEGVDLAKKEHVDFILAVGGGSVIDTVKLIAVGALVDQDPWKMVTGEISPEKGLPIGSILTLSATGSEMDTDSVITKEETGQKLGRGSPHLRPKFAIMNPEYTFSVNPHHTAAGTADIMSHTMENYFTVDDSYFLQDRISEGILKTCVQYGPIAIEEPENYEGRANIMWAASWAIYGLISTGKEVDWSVHPMQHELSALRDITMVLVFYFNSLLVRVFFK